ncbi:hypothetical protein NC796_00450 [Aliifodinibius sp. S!AR15-10]|nr:hypothetical protein [Aliifodinibius sp. S!AR15-10]
MAVSQSPDTYTLEDVFEHMTREGSTITKAEALAGFEEVTQGIINLLAQGNSVVTPLVNISPSISGVFDGDEDRFDPDRHQVNINFSSGVRMRDLPSEIPTEKIEPKEREPKLRHFHAAAMNFVNLGDGVLVGEEYLVLTGIDCVVRKKLLKKSVPVGCDDAVYRYAP